MGELGLCTISDITNFVSVQLLSDITTDTGLPLFLIRLLHNKPIYYFISSLRCYLLYFDASQLMRFISPILIPFIIYSLFSRSFRLPVLILFFIFPLFLILNPFDFILSTRIYFFQALYIIIAITGFTKMILSLKSK